MFQLYMLYSDGVKYKDKIMHQIVLKAVVWKPLVFLSYYLMSQNGFESNFPETKFQTITFWSQSKSSHNQMFLNIGALKNFTTGKYMCWSLFLS